MITINICKSSCYVATNSALPLFTTQNCIIDDIPFVYCRDFNFDSALSNLDTITSKNKEGTINYYNTPFCFDIEVSSFYQNDNKRACMYIFMFAINGNFTYGRTWDDFFYIINILKNTLNLSHNNRIIIYVHNLSYEFQFLFTKFCCNKVFARDTRHPIKFLADDCIEFKCSYYLSGLSLAKVAEELGDVSKKVGDLDYNLLRTPISPLTKKEMSYCLYDVVVLHKFICKEISKNDNNIIKIPLTKTGYVRRYCRDYIRKHTNYKIYRDKICKCAPLDPDLFCLLNKSFMGGYTHANCIYIDSIIANVHSIDFTSSYPSVMILNKYPMSPFTKVTPQNLNEFNKLINKYACVFDVKFTNIIAKSNHHTLSSSKCKLSYNTKIDNGRVVASDALVTYMTDIDYKDFILFYDYDKISVNNMYISVYDYLPKTLIECVLKFYNDKTTLKEIPGKEDFYMVAKNMLNSTFGMCVTNPINDDIIFEGGEWSKKQKNIFDCLKDSYINNKKQVLLYQWGVWITAHARHNLYNGMLSIGNDVIYCDTDSIKFVNYSKHKKYIEMYNKNIKNQLKTRLSQLGLPLELGFPKNINGDVLPLGVWTYEGMYNKFKTLGAKRYCYIKNDEFNFTVSGLNKETAVPYILDVTNNPMTFFTFDMYIPNTYTKNNYKFNPTGKTTMTYIYDPYICKITDYLGNNFTVQEDSYIHAEPQEYNMSISSTFLDYLVKEVRIDLIKNNKIGSKRNELKINLWD